MKFIIQRVQNASVCVDGTTAGAINGGFLILIGISGEDTQEIADKMLRKAMNLRIFPDTEGKTNCSLHDVDGELLMIPQFTLYANCKKGNRPSFFEAGEPSYAEKLYKYLLKSAQSYCKKVESGIFGADMKVSLLNDGPFTIILDSKDLF